MRTHRKIAMILAPALSLAALSVAPAASASSAYKVTVKVSKTTIHLGDKITASGTVSPKAPGKTVKVYVHYASDSDGEYHYVGKDKLSSKSKYSKKFTPKDSGTTKIKVVKAKSKSHKAGSHTKTFKNYGYMPLTKLVRVVENGTVQHRSDIELGGEVTKGIKFLGDGRARYDLKGQCNGYEAIVGMDDNSMAGAEGQYKAVSENAAQDEIDEGSTYSSTVGDVPDDDQLFIGGARFLVLTTQVSASAWSVALPEVHCNLAGGYEVSKYDLG